MLRGHCAGVSVAPSPAHPGDMPRFLGLGARVARFHLMETEMNVKLTLGGKAYTLPPLTIEQLREISGRLHHGPVHDRDLDIVYAAWPGRSGPERDSGYPQRDGRGSRQIRRSGPLALPSRHSPPRAEAAQ